MTEADNYQTDVLSGLDSKQPKVVAGSISCLKEIIEFVIPPLASAHGEYA